MRRFHTKLLFNSVNEFMIVILLFYRSVTRGITERKGTEEKDSN